MKHNWKRLGAMLLALAMVFSLVPTAALAARVEGEVAIDAPAADAGTAQTAELPGGADDEPAALMAGEQMIIGAPYRKYTADDVEEGRYIIYDNGFNLHNTNGTTGDHCDSPTPSNGILDPGHASDSHNPYDHVWIIAGNATEGYTIQSATTVESEQNYLAIPTSDTDKPALKASAAATPQKFSITKSGEDYQIVTKGNVTKYLYFNTTDRKWLLSSTETSGAVELYKATTTSVTITDASDNSRDVGVTNGTYSNPLESNGATNSETVVRAWASSQEGRTGDGETDCAAWVAVDGVVADGAKKWHSRYSGSSDTAIEDPTQLTIGGYGTAKMSSSKENRWIELDIMSSGTVATEGVWLSGLRYLGNSSNGKVQVCEIRVSTDGEHWTSMNSDFNNTTNNWTLTNNGWNYKEFDYPVKVNRVRLYGEATQGNNQYMNAREIRLVKALEADVANVHSASITVSGVESDTEVTVVAGGQSVTVTGNTVAMIPNLIDDQEYTVTATAEGYMSGTTTVTGMESATATVSLALINRTITGKVTTDGTTGLAGAKVELLNADTNRSFVAGGPTDTSGEDGVYTLRVNTLPAGNYYVRASKAGHSTKLSADYVTVEATEATETDTVADMTLEAITTRDGDYKWSFDEGDKPADGALSTGSGATATYENNKLKLVWANGNRDNNLVNINNTNTKNFTIEFDATRSAGQSMRFGLAIRSHGDPTDGGQYWVYVGQTNDNTWGVEKFKTTTAEGTTTTKSGGWSDNISGSDKPFFRGGETRHFKVVAEDSAVTLYVDGIEILTTDNIATYTNHTNANSVSISATDIDAAGDIGFLWGRDYELDQEGFNQSHTIEIDNLYVLRNDPKNELTLAGVDNGTVSAKYTENGTDYPITSGTTRVPNGALVTVTGMPTNTDTHVLDSIAVARTGEGEAVTVRATRTQENTFTFNMPNAPVTVTGKFLPKLTEVTVDTSAGLKVNKTVTASAKAGETTPASGVNYVWEHQNPASGEQEAQWVACNVTTAAKTIGGDDLGKLIRVTATGDGTTYASTVSVTWTSTGNVAAADVPLQSVDIARTSISMVANGEESDSDTDSQVGKTTILTANITPGEATSPRYTWKIYDAAEGGNEIASSDSSIVKLEDVQGNLHQQKVTAQKVGEVWVEVSVSAAEGGPATDRVHITVTNDLKGITVKNNGAEVTNKIIIYANSDTELSSQPDKVNKVTLTAERNPADNTDALDWAVTKRPNGLTEGGIQVQIAQDGGNTLSAEVRFPIGEDGSVQTGDFQGKLGEYQVTVSHGDVSKVITFELRRYVSRDISMTITEVQDQSVAPKYGQHLRANIQNLAMSDAGKAALKFEWFALDPVEGSAPTEIPSEAQPFVTDTTSDLGEDNGRTIELVNTHLTEGQSLVGKYIAVRISATPDNTNFYEGSKVAIRAQAVAKADGPSIPADSTIHGVKGESEDQPNGKITGFPTDDGNAYEYKLATAEDTESNWTTVSGSEATNVTPGDYVVRIKATATHNAGAERNVSVGAWNSNLFQVELAAATNGSVVCNPAQAEAGATVTVTVKPNAGYELDTLTVTPSTSSGAGEALETSEGTATADGRVFTFTVPETFNDTTNDKVTVSATFKKIKLTIDHSGLKNIKCSLDTGDGSHSTTHTVEYGTEDVITLVPNTGYTLPARNAIQVLNTDVDPAVDPGGWQLSNGKITFPLSGGTGGVIHNLKIVAEGVPETYNVTRNVTNGLAINYTANVATYGQNYTATLSVLTAQQENYTLPDSITVTRGETTLTQGTDYTYNSTSGAITINASAVTGNLTITAEGKVIVKTVTAVTISGSAEVGQTLTVATITPTGINVDYQWQRADAQNGTYSDIAGADKSTYKLTTDDLNKYVRVQVSARAPHNGTPTSDPVGPVKPEVIAAEAVTISGGNKVTFGQTLQLTATTSRTSDDRTPTETSVVWRVTSGNDVVSVDGNGKVTPQKVGTATIQAQVVKATDVAGSASGVTSTVNITVDPATYTVSLTGTLQAGQDLTVVTEPASLTFRNYTWYWVDVEHDTETQIENATGTSLILQEVYVGGKIKVTVSDVQDDNYTDTGSTTSYTTTKTVQSATVTLPDYTVTVNTPEHGTVTADPTTAKEGTTVTLTVTPDNGYELGTLTVKDGENNAVTVNSDNTFTMPDSNVTVSATFTEVQPTTYAITTAVEPANSGRVELSVEGRGVTYAEEGAVVYVAANPNGDYVLSTITAKDADGQAVTVTHEGSNYYFTMPAKAVTVTATFTTDPVTPPEVDKTALTAAIEAAKAAKEGVLVTDKAANAVEKDTHYVTTAQDTALTTAIATAQAVLDKATATQTEVDEAVTALNSAVTTFNTAKNAQVGTMDDAALVAAITAARTAKAAVNVLPDETTEDDVKTGVKFVTKSEMTAFDADIKAAETALNAADKDQTTLDAAKGTLTAATTAFTDVTTKTGRNDDAEAPVVDTAALDAAIEAANAAKTGVVIGTDPAQVNSGTKFVTQDVMNALNDAIAAAEEAKADENKTDGSVANAVDALNAAVETFNAAKQDGTKSTGGSSSSSRPSGSTTVETKPDGTKVTTETKSDGTKVVTTEKPDGAKEVVETKKDGTVTETKTDAEGAKTEKVTTPDKDVTITVTDKDGEELAKVELPAEIAPIPEENKFEDLAPTPWAEEAINNVASLKLVEGVGGKKYAPTESMTRGQLATVLHRLSQGKTDYEVTFRDVANDKYYTQGVAWAAKAGVVKGFSEDIFAPDQIISREQLAVMLCRYAKLIGLDTAADAEALNTFTDGEKTSDWAVDSLAWCVKSGILQGKGGSVLDPTANVSRAEAAAMLDRFISLMK